ncbi:EAL domain-containing protein [Paenibacillus sp. LHD-117]|uniref:putative bifunctional diguanylate cyclase/phosphodiesterase n=1 Tax=Paenibacillus sp. LHD-117 TaxID=3071412 RepID=UPI0027E1A35C|nr:EAL domain-containing protein [Paenibacillus sp. LHD-117]MDQ6423192.1 EAL domain-containing protein [Paenibacillus sp. LHD-117]
MNSLQGSYDGWIVFISFVIALITSYSALNLAYKTSHSSGIARMGWLIVSGVVMGCGIWTMHFVGMIAFHVDVEVSYHVPTTAISILASIMASLLAFYVTMSRKVTRAKLAAGSLLMGAGIVTMHYTGMASMESEFLQITYDSTLWGASALVAVIASCAALYLLTRFKEGSITFWLKWLAAILMGIAVSGMHYTGMEAAEFWCFPTESTGSSTPERFDSSMLMSISFVMAIMVSVTWLALHWERVLLKRLAYSDSLTGLPNRHAMNHIFEEKLKLSGGSSVMYIDLDQFKLINDTLGHDMGDLLVQEVANRLNQFVNRSRFVFRLGGDEFLLLVNDLKEEKVEALASQMLEELRRPYWLEGNELYVTVSIGISYAPRHGTNRSSLLKAADTAMYYAKSLGKNQFCAYNEELDRRLSRRMEIEKGLRTALILQQFTTYYQPKWNDATNRPIGFEALLRWEHPRLGPIAPDEFIPVAEETGLIIPMTRWVLEQACSDCRSWNERMDAGLGVSVNLSAHLFESSSLPDMVNEALTRSGIPPSMLELEITEATVMYYATEAEAQLAPLQRDGVRVTMDNFGSGYSFLGSIDRISFQTLKIDRLYMQDYESPSKRAIVGTIITLAKQLEIELIAEGVETESQLEFLRSAGCSIMQGYYFKKPMPKEEVDSWLAELIA